MKKGYVLMALMVMSMIFTACMDNASRDGSIAQKEKDNEIQAPEKGKSRISVSIEFDENAIYVSKCPVGVKITRVDNHVVVHSRAKNIAYILKGHASDASFKLYSDHQFILNLSNLSLVNPRGAAINIQSPRHGFVALSGQSVLSDGREYTNTPVGELPASACFYSEGNLIFCGDGQLVMKSNYKHAVACKGYLRVSQKADLIVTSAVKDGLNVGKNILIDGGSLDITVLDDAVKCAGDLVIAGGDILLRSKGGEGGEGLEGNTVTIREGVLKVLAYDDAINAAQSIEIDGGSIYAYSVNNDAIDANGSIDIKGGLVVAVGTHVPECGIDCDMNPITIEGGTVLAIGGSNSFPNSRNSDQLSLSYGAALTEGDYLSVCDAQGESVLIYKIPRTYNEANLLYSSPLLKKDAAYSLFLGGSVNGGIDAYGLWLDAQYTGGKKQLDFNIEGTVTTLGKVGMGGPRAFPQGGPQGVPPQGFPQGGPQGVPPQGFPQDGPQGVPPQGFPQDFPQGGSRMPFGGTAEFPSDFPPSTPTQLP